MKKAQILGALALAFALGLGVVMPAANTYAITFTDNGKVVEDLDKKVEDAIEAAKDKCGYRYVESRKAYYYSDYKNLVEVIDSASEKVKKTESQQVSVASLYDDDDALITNGGLVDAYKEAISTLKGQVKTLPASVEETIPENKTSYNSVVDYINGVMTTLNKKAETVSDQDADKADAKNYRIAADALKAALKAAEKNIDATKATEAKKIQTAIETINDDEKFDDKLTYAEALKTANGLSSNNGFTTVAKVRSLMTAIERAEDILASDATENYKTADQLINAINKALNGGTVTDADLPEVPADNNKPSLTSPDTGILADAEGNATTTVAMVAGIATALTAAGAGVVAYRNARRSSRK